MQHKWRNVLDLIVVSAYSFISLGCVWIDTASYVVALLNLLCLARAFFGNSINASIAKQRKPVEIDSYARYIRHLVKAILMFALTSLMLVIATMLFIEKGTSVVLKFISSVCIVMVLWNDFENILFRAYDVHI